MLIYVWVVVGALAAVVVVCLVVLVGWVLMLRRIAQSGIRSWDELEAEDADLDPFR